MQKRASGVLLHPTSLPGNHGIGALGAAARSFIDFLVKARQTYWQILPLGPTGYGDSPYQCFSSNAGNPYLIDLDQLCTDGFLQASDVPAWHDAHPNVVDYGAVIDFKMQVLRKAYVSFDADAHADYGTFMQAQQSWINDYCLFMALKDKFEKQPWYEWEDAYRLRDADTLATEQEALASEIGFHAFLQFVFFKQWKAIKQYANQHGVQIIGDIPIYVAMDSSDTWCNPELFQFDANKTPLAVGGCPPDYFSETGQLWGNPIYDYAKMEEDNFAWWIARIRSNLELYDLIRVDHFRGFAGYWSIPYGAPTAVTGEWVDGPGKKLFQAIQDALGEIPIIAEDLGLITPDVIELRDHFGLPGMKILQFAFDSSEANDYIPHNYTSNCVVYTGTHDNDTALGWFQSAKEDDKRYMLLYLNSDGRDICKDLIRAAWSSVAQTAIVPMQDLLRLGTEARMNLPGTTVNNWLWRMSASDLRTDLAEELMGLTMLYARGRS